jgi:hypothetical protein
LELWAIGRHDLGLSEIEFWGITLRQFDALLERYKLNQKWENYRPALICSTLANLYRDPKSNPYTPRDFMPGEKNETKKSPDEILQKLKNWQGYFEVKK